MDIAIITGASSGIGKEFLFQANSYINVDEIWVISRNEKELESLKLITKFKLRILPLDLTKDSSLKKIKELLDNEKPNIKLLINSSGYGKMGDFDQIALEDDMGMIDLNIKALVAITRFSTPYMTNGARIIQMASRAGFYPLPYMTTYAASKSFVLSYSEALAMELKPKKIRVVAVCPSFVKTKFISRADSKENDKFRNFGKLYNASDIVKRAYHDAYKTKKLVSIYGGEVKFTKFMARFLSIKSQMKIFLHMQKKKVN